MSKIVILPDSVIVQVAAGEVIENPVAVVKELLDNAIDAQATEIHVELEEAGKKRIFVWDNGTGMSAQDLALSWQHHSTSKIRTTNDLLKISTLGFRGEALSSIAAVSDLTLRSRQKAQTTGNELQVNFGQQVGAVQPIGMAMGTKVIVRDLFAHLPVRHGFFPTTKSLSRQVLLLLNRYAVTHPQIMFHLQMNEKTTVWNQQASLAERLVEVLGQKNFSYYLPLSYHAEHVSISGFIGKPQQARRHASHQFVSVNQRVVEDHPFAPTITQAFGTLLEAGMQPSFVLAIEVPVEAVDPNIHPQKKSVRILNQETILRELEQTIKQLLKEHDVSYSYGETWRVEESSPQSEMGQKLRRAITPWQVKENTQFTDISQLHKLYLVTENDAGILLVDQHAAHERILYEQFLEAWNKGELLSEIYELPEPQKVELSSIDAAELETFLSELSQLGWTLEPLHEQTFVVTTLPKIFRDKDPQLLLLSVIDDLQHGPLSSSLHPHHHRLIAYLACRTAIKAGEVLNPEERRRLLQKLAETKTQYTCPHGRPVYLELSLGEVEKLFKRA